MAAVCAAGPEPTIANLVLILSGLLAAAQHRKATLCRDIRDLVQGLVSPFFVNDIERIFPIEY